MGLLDHLLKHLAETVVAPGGERLRRCHNVQGRMEYWLQQLAEDAEGAAHATISVVLG